MITWSRLIAAGEVTLRQDTVNTIHTTPPTAMDVLIPTLYRAFDKYVAVKNLK